MNELPAFSRAGIAGIVLNLVKVNPAETVARVLEREASSTIPIETSVDAGLNTLAEPETCFANVVPNAIRYAGDAGPIQVSPRAEDGRIYLTVADHGPGVPEDTPEEIFAALLLS